MIQELLQIELMSWLKGGLIVLTWIAITGFLASRLFQFAGDDDEND